MDVEPEICGGVSSTKKYIIHSLDTNSAVGYRRKLQSL
jgi:hypothetical protein